VQDVDLKGLAVVARETFEYNLVPWAGRKYAAWVRAWSRPHPKDPGLMLVPEVIYHAFRDRTPGEPLSKQQVTALGYPRVPGEEELEQVRRELHDALGRCDWDEARELDHRLRELQERVAAVRQVALRRATTASPTSLDARAGAPRR
jgi:hypothetical protein